MLYNIFYFDKIKDLNGYSLKVGVFHEPLVFDEYDEAETGYDRFKGFDFELIRTALKYVNARFVVKISDDYGFFDEQGSPHGTMTDILSSTIDLAINTYFLQDYWKMQAYPFDTEALTIVSRKLPVKKKQ